VHAVAVQEAPETRADDFLVAGMRTVTSVALPARSCTRFDVALAGTLRDVDLLLLDDTGQILASDLREAGPPVLLACTVAPAAVHVLARVVSGAGHVALSVVHTPRTESPRAGRPEDVPEETFVDLDEPSPYHVLRAQVAVLARRGFLHAEPVTGDVLTELGALEVPVRVAPGECITLVVVGDAALSLTGANGDVLADASVEGDVRAVQACTEGPLRGVVAGRAGTRVLVLVARGRSVDVGGASGLWLGHAP
jgi:hypothetical protein